MTCDSEGVVPSSWVRKEAPHINASVMTKFEEVVGGKWKARKLCKTLLDFIMCSGMPVPPYSDTACYIVDGKAACDVDVSPATLRNITEQAVEIKDTHSLAGGAIALQTNANFSKSRQKLKIKLRRKFTETVRHVKSDYSLPHCTDMEVYKVVKHVANVFRIFPAGLPSVTKGLEANLDAELTEVATDMEAGAHRTHVFGRRRRRRNCCSTRRRRGKESSARRRNCQWDLAAYHRRREANCQSQSADLWAAKLAQADGWMSSAASKFDKGQTASLRTKWFGTSGTRDNVQSIYESIENVFDSGVEFVWPADDLGICSEPSAGSGTLAYVYPQHGNFKFYICQLLTDFDSSTQIATMVHEAAHHYPGRLRDKTVEHNGKTYGPYSESDKKWMAKNAPESAVANAGNFESYIADVNR